MYNLPVYNTNKDKQFAEWDAATPDETGEETKLNRQFVGPEILLCSDTLPLIGNNITKHFHANSPEPGRGQLFWDRFFLNLAKTVSEASKDPSTKVGAVIVDADRRVISCGYNGFAKGVDDSPERYADREYKLLAVVHAETNAILFAQRPLKNCVLYTWPFMSCAKCAGLVINAGITRCVAPTPSEGIKERWGKQMEISKQMFCEAGVKLEELEFE